MPRLLVIAMLLLAACKSPGPGSVHGWVVPGTIHTELVGDAFVHTFTIEEKGKQTEVRYTGPKPDLLKERAGVTVRGQVRDGVLETTDIRMDSPYP